MVKRNQQGEVLDFNPQFRFGFGMTLEKKSLSALMHVAKYLNVCVCCGGAILCFGELCIADKVLGLDLGVQAGNSNSKSAPGGKSHQNMQELRTQDWMDTSVSFIFPYMCFYSPPHPFPLFPLVFFPPCLGRTL